MGAFLQDFENFGKRHNSLEKWGDLPISNGVELPSLESLKKSLETPPKEGNSRATEDWFLPWKQFSAAAAPKVRRIIWLNLGSVDAAIVEDLTSDVFTWVVETLKREPSKFVNIEHLEARTILKARSMSIDYIRHKIHSPVVEAKPEIAKDGLASDECGQSSFENKHADNCPSPVDEAQEKELAEILLNLLGNIKPNHREVLKLIFLENKTQREAADALGMPIGTVGVYHTRGLKEIKKEIARHPHLLEDIKDTYGILRLTCEIAIMALLLK